MKTEAIKQSIVSNYKILDKMSQIKSNKSDAATIWGLQYRPGNKQDGFVNAIGVVERNKAKIEVRDNEIKMVKKSFFSTWKKTLNDINAMLEGIILNFDNHDVVTKRYVKVHCFTKDFIEKLEKIDKGVNKR